MNDITNKYRQARKGNTDIVVIEGVHAFKHAVRFGAELVHVALSPSSEARDVLAKFGTKAELDILEKYAETLTQERWESLTPNPHSTGIVALAKKPKTTTEFVGDTIVCIENPNSLFNVGAIIRTLAAAGVESFTMTGRHNPWHADCINTSRGLHWVLKHISLLDNITDIKKLAKDKDYTIYALDTDTNLELSDIKNDTGKKIFLFGTERDGLSDEALLMAEKTIKIPMRQGVSSLNLASSVAVTVYADML